jgi:hypothetical protein
MRPMNWDGITRLPRSSRTVTVIVINPADSEEFHGVPGFLLRLCEHVLRKMHDMPVAHSVAFVKRYCKRARFDSCSSIFGWDIRIRT